MEGHARAKEKLVNWVGTRKRMFLPKNGRRPSALGAGFESCPLQVLRRRPREILGTNSPAPVWQYGMEHITPIPPSLNRRNEPETCGFDESR